MQQVSLLLQEVEPCLQQLLSFVELPLRTRRDTYHVPDEGDEDWYISIVMRGWGG